MKSISKFHYNCKKQKYEVNSGEIKVEPCSCLSIKDIFERFRLGLPLDSSVCINDSYDEESSTFLDINTIKQPDLVSKIDLVASLHEFNKSASETSVSRSEMGVEEVQPLNESAEESDNIEKS